MPGGGGGGGGGLAPANIVDVCYTGVRKSYPLRATVNTSASSQEQDHHRGANDGGNTPDEPWIIVIKKCL